jgi:hypothetical protein
VSGHKVLEKVLMARGHKVLEKVLTEEKPKSNKFAIL